MTRRIIGVVLAIVLAVIGTGAVLLYVNSARNTVANGQRAVHILVAKDRIPAGTSGDRIRSEGLAEDLVVPASTVPDDALSKLPGELDKLVITADVQARQVLLRGMFGQATKLSGGLDIPEGTVALSVAINVNQQVGGFVRPGSQVAIFDTYGLDDSGKVTAPNSNANNGKGSTTTRVLLPRVEVIAVGVFGANGVTSNQVQVNGDKTNNQNGNSGGQIIVTVAVNQVDAERLILASQTGTLYFALLTDSSNVKPDPGIDTQTLFS
jgi:pilus assembly protein CpaB